MSGMFLMMIPQILIGFCIYGLYALFCNWIFRLLLRPLAVPESFAAERKRERLMTFLIFVALPMTWFGVLLLLGTYSVGMYRHLKERQAMEAGKPVPVLPRIPRIALSELLVMVFSVALFPLLVSAIIEAFTRPFPLGAENIETMKAVVRVSAMVIGLLIFPLCFASAYHRLDANRVGLGSTRMAFLFVYPYMTFAMHTLVAGPLIALLAFGVMTFIAQTRAGGRGNDQQNEVWTNVGLVLLLALMVLLAGVVLARRAKREAARGDAGAGEPVTGGDPFATASPRRGGIGEAEAFDGRQA